MPAVSKKQQRFMGMVHALNKGEIKPSDVSKDVQDVAKDMKKKDAKDFASTKHKGLPMKKEQMINRLKEMIRQELSEYTYGVGDIVKDVNPSCLHYGAIGKVKEVNPEYVTFVVTNNGDNFSKGQTLEKSHDQMKKMNEGSMDWEKKHFPWANKEEQMMIAKLVFSNKDGIDGEVKRQKKNPSSYKNHIKSMVKKGLHESINESTARNDKSIGTKNYKGVGWFWPNDGWKHYLRDVENAGRKEVHDLWLKAGFEVKKDNRGIPHFDIKPNERSKAMDIVNKLDRSKKYKHANESVNESKKEKDQIIKYLQGLGFDERTAKNAVAKSYDYISKAYRSTGTRYKGDLIANILNKKESVNEANPKDTIATIDMVNALLKIKSPMSRQTLDALKMMVRHHGLDNIKKEVQRDARKFYKSLQKMEKGLTQDIELESIIKEDYFVNNGQDFSKNFLTGLDLVISQANNLKGQLAKHPVKRDVNKLKAVQTIYKKFLQPSIDKENDRFKAVNLTRLKDFLKDGKFRNAIEYEILSALDTRSYNSNSYYFLDDKHKELIKKLTRSLKDITNKLEKGQFESVNEASVSQVRSTISRVKKQLMQKWAKKGGYENFGQKELRKLKDKFKENPYGSPEERQISDMLSAFNKWAMNYSGDMRESVNEAWAGDVNVKKTGEHADKTITQLKSELDALKNKSKSYQDKGQSVPKSIIDQEAEIKFAIRAKQGWKKGKGAMGESVIKEAGGVEKILDMARNNSYGKLGGQTVDGLTANLFKAVYDKAPQAAKDKVNKMNERELVRFMGNLWNKFGKNVSLRSS